MSAEKPRQARSLSSSRVIGPVVSCEPTVVIFGSQYVPGGCPAFRQAAGATDHLLGQRVALARIVRLLRQTEQRRHRQAQRFTRLGRQAAADDQRDTAAGADFVQDHQGLQLRFGDHGTVLSAVTLAVA